MLCFKIKWRFLCTCIQHNQLFFARMSSKNDCRWMPSTRYKTSFIISLDWRRDDYPFEVEEPDKKSGRRGKGDYASYLQFMKNQLTELLTNYGSIAGILVWWPWDQTAPEGEQNRTSRMEQIWWNWLTTYNHNVEPTATIIAFLAFRMFSFRKTKAGLNFQQPCDYRVLLSLIKLIIIC